MIYILFYSDFDTESKKKATKLKLAKLQSQAVRHERDLYETPLECTRALIKNWYEDYPYKGMIWEPCCGPGKLAGQLRRYTPSVYCSDIHDYGYKHQNEVVDFLSVEKARAPIIITNPPFVIADHIINKGMQLGVRSMALLLKSNYWHAASRVPLFKKYPPKTIAAMTWRPNFTGGKGGMMDCIWCIWEEGYAGNTEYVLFTKPFSL